MLFISDLEVNIKLLLMTFVDDIMVTEIAKNENPWPDVASTACLGQTNVFYCTKMLLTNPEQKPGQAWHCQL